MRLLPTDLRITIAAVTLAVTSPGASPLAAQGAPPSRLLSSPGSQGTCAVARYRVVTSQRDSGTTRTLTIAEAGKTVRQIVITEDPRGQPTQVSDVLLSSMEKVDVHLGAAQPRVSWHTTDDAGMADPSAVAAARRLAATVLRRCPGP